MLQVCQKCFRSLRLLPKCASLTAGAESVASGVCSTAFCVSSQGKLEGCDHVCHIADSPFPCTCSSVGFAIVPCVHMDACLGWFGAVACVSCKMLRTGAAVAILSTVTRSNFSSGGNGDCLW